ncbi:hypothetical protein EUX98_g2904 [Antrodiella citrinella]|uniref:Uncharacterized protein n=1 Tax=Antrodiella citrinella TaxID=2447956 RepID=A0A4S4N0J9_9APHY|nr:hypothetical protein EUX98_g2904 [Antrodiella citrinella]
MTKSKTRVALDRDLAQCRDKYDRLRLSNASAPVSQLPPEILTSILLLLMQDWMSTWMRSYPSLDNHQSSNNTHPSSWMTYTHVYHRWREAALHCKTLWSSFVIQNGSSELVDTMISRSGEMPLRVHIQFWDDNAPRNVLSVLKELHRVEELVFSSGFNVNIFPPLKTLDLGDAPILRHLRMVKSSIWYPNLQVTYPVLGCLEELVFWDVPHDEFASLLRPTLTHLTLEFTTGDGSALALLLALRKLENLQFLKIAQQMNNRWRFSKVAQPVSHHARLGPETKWVHITLPHLRRMELYTDNRTTPWNTFLHHLSVPASARFSVRFTRQNPVALDVLAFFRNRVETFDCTQSHPGVDWPFTSFAIEPYRFVLWSVDSDSDNTSSRARFTSHQDSEKSSWYSHIHLEFAHLRISNAMLSAFRLSLSDVRELYYEWDPSENMEVVRAALDNMRHVETLCVPPESYVPDDLSVHIGVASPSDDTNPQHPPPSVHPYALFPALKTLIIIGLHSAPWTLHEWKKWWSKLIAALASRRDSGVVPRVEKLFLFLPPADKRHRFEVLPIATDVQEALGVVTEFVEVRGDSRHQGQVLRRVSEENGCPRGFVEFVDSKC